MSFKLVLLLGILSLGTALPAQVFSEDFDSVTTPALPSGWTAGGSGAGNAWASVSTQANSNPNSVFADDPSSTNAQTLETPTINIGASGTHVLEFQHWYDMEAYAGTGAYDGGTLEINIAGGGYQGVVAAGGSFLQGGYTHVGGVLLGALSSSEGAWSGDSLGFVVTQLQLPASAAGQSVTFRFSQLADSSAGGTGWWIDDVSVDVLAADDVGVESIDAPVSGPGLTATETVTVTLRNYGSASQSNFPVSFTVNSGTPVTETYTGPLASGSTDTFTFAATADLSTPSTTYTISASTGLTTDVNSANDTASSDIRHIGVVSTFPYLEDFEGATAQDWTASGTPATLWELGTPTNVGPAAAQSGTDCFGTDVDANYGVDGADAFLDSPVFDLTGSAAPEFRFFHHVDSESTWDGGTLQISVNGGAYVSLSDTDPGFSQNGPNSTNVVGTGAPGWSGNPTSAGWEQVVINLTALTSATVTTSDTVRFRFWFGSDGSTNNYPGWYIDDVSMDEGTAPEIEVEQPASTPVSDPHDVGTLPTGTPTSVTWTIRNSGNADLNITNDEVQLSAGVNLTGLPATVAIVPTGPIAANGGTATFTVDIEPTAGVAFSFTVNILSDDPVTPDFQFDVEGDGSTNAPPTLDLAAGGSSFTAGSDFDLAVDPGTTLNQADLEVDDASPDPVDVTVAFDTGPMGATPPTNITAPASGSFTTAQLPGALSWTGTADANDDPGTYTWTVTLDDGVNTPIDFDVNFTINDLDPTHVAATGITGDGLAAGTAYATTVQVGSTAGVDIADIDDANLSQTIVIDSDTETAAPGSATMTFDWSTTGTNPATLVATPSAAPDAADVGDFEYEVVVEDDNNNTVTIFVVITVEGTAPTITSSAAPTQAPDGGSFNHTFTATGNPTPTFAVTTGTLPGWANLDPNTGLLDGTPVLGQDINVTISAQNGIAPDDTEVVNVTVVAGTAPTITSSAAPTTATEGTLYTHTFTATGTPAPTFSVTAGGPLPTWLTLTTGGVLSGTPAAGDVGTVGPFTVTASNGVNPDATEDVTITVNASGGGGGGGGGSDGGGGCAASTNGFNWLALLGLLSVVAIAARVRASRS